MDKEGEPRIKLGVDPQGRTIDILEAEPRAQYYTCPVCRQFLIVRHGDINIWHFAHSTAEEDSPECELRTETGWEEYVRRQRVSPVESMEKNREMRTQILVNPYTGELRLVGILPVPTYEEFPHAYSIDTVLKSIRISGIGEDAGLSDQSFHPRNPEAVVFLGTTSEGSITIESTPKLISIVGSWKARPLAEGDVLKGDWSRAELVGPGWRANPGDVIYVVRDVHGYSIPDITKVFTLGRHRVLAFEVRPESMVLLKSLFPEMERIPSSFSASMILPSWVDARSVGPIGGPPGEQVLIGIHPPSGLSPEFEIVTVPLDPDRIETISSREVKSASVFYRTRFPDRGSKRISIHWGTNHRLVHLYASPSYIPADRSSELPLGARVTLPNGETMLFSPWNANPEVRLSISDRHKPHIEIVGPPEMTVDMTGQNTEDRNPLSVFESDVTQSSVNSIIESWTQEGYLDIAIGFGPMGWVGLKFSSGGPAPLTIEEIEKRILAMDHLPRKATWKLLREVAGVPEGTPHHLVTQVRMSQIRIALWNLRKRHAG